MTPFVGLSSVLVLSAPVRFAAGNSSSIGRRLSYTRITGYEPYSDVTKLARIDLDQQEFEQSLAAGDWTAAKRIYQLGAHAGSRAVLTISSLSAAQNAGTGRTVRQASTGAQGTLTVADLGGAHTITVSYQSVCKEGGTTAPDTSGCFTTTGTLSINNIDIGVPTAVTNQYITLASLSTGAYSMMSGQEYFTEYRAYYNQGDYGNGMVIDALDGVHLCHNCDDVARAEIAKKSSVYMNVWMYVIGEMEEAIINCQNDCNNCNDEQAHSWDEALAVYSGSLAGILLSGGTGNGNLLYTLAQKRCAEFNTCNADGVAKVNKEIITTFSHGRDRLLLGRCSEVIAMKRTIADQMSVPLIQGSLAYAWRLQINPISQVRAEAAVFSAAILPRVAACSAEAAQTIADILRWHAPACTGNCMSRFARVKASFESVYPCLGVTCEDVGGIFNEASGQYEPGAEPCVTASGSSSDSDITDTTAFMVSIIVVAILAFIAVLAAVACHCRARKYQQMLGDVGGPMPQVYGGPASGGPEPQVWARQAPKSPVAISPRAETCIVQEINVQ